MVFNYSDFTPIDDRVLVQPGPVYKVKSIQSVREDKKDTSIKPLNKNVKVPEVDLVQKELEVRTALRVGKVLKVGVGTAPVPYKEGDWVVYFIKNAIPYDLLAKYDPDEDCPLILKRYDIVSIVNEEGVNKIIKEQNETSKEDKESN